MARKVKSPALRQTTRAERAAKKTAPTQIEKRLSDAVIKKAASTGLMPHEILLRAARGEAFTVRKLIITKYKDGPNRGQEKSREWVEELYYPTFNEQIECARSAAPYFAPRLATQVVKTDENTSAALTGVLAELAKKVPV